ncbi:MAG: CPBP family intramembrane metalloprotease [Cyclobacteriaceae bacterium]|nr:CPBP family intramembrane metalloprotease [Cyclobacteriaceae bacterium]
MKLSLDYNREESFGNRIVTLVKCYVASLVVKGFSVFTIRFLDSFIFNGKMPLMREKAKISEFYSLEISLLLVIIIIPILEEIAFRGWLTKSKQVVAFSLYATLIYFLQTFIVLVSDFGIKISLLDKVFIFSIFSIVTIYFLYSKIERLAHHIYNNLRSSIIISISLFSFIHIFNYPSPNWSLSNLVALLIILAPHAATGFIYSYIRIKNGLIWSVVLHILNNSIVLIPVLLLNKRI